MTTPKLDERMGRVSFFTTALRRPEFGALIGALVIFTVFALVDTTGQFAQLQGAAGWTKFAAPVGIVSIFVALLMIAGEFDLSSGVMVGTAGLLMGNLVSEVGMGVWEAMLVTMMFAAIVGLINGILVIRTGLPSFIVTLATFFVLKGVNLAVTKMLTGTVRVDGVDEGAGFDAIVDLPAASIEPQVTWGTSPQMVVPVGGRVPDPADATDPVRRDGIERALKYMGLKPNTRIQDIAIDKVFIGSCTNSRIEDLRAAAAVAKGRKVAPNVKLAMVVPGSGLVKEQAEKEGLHEVFTAAGFEWREPGCSMCLGMNDDRLEPGERCASTSNRNFEGRQGAGGRTHLVSPAMAAAAAVSGHFVDVRTLGKGA